MVASGGGAKRRPAADADLEAPFRTSVERYLERYARLEAPPSPQLQSWKIALRLGRREPVQVNVVVESVPLSRSIYCDQCRVVGWSCHPVCGKRYHFIICNEANSACTRKICIQCGFLFDSSDVRCANCSYELSHEDVVDRVYQQLDDTTHLLHGVVHANGYGHLLRVNGREGGSKVMTGCEIMDFWDNLCRLLHVRKISVMDISKKFGLEYRLLHAITTGRTWYGEWGYEFGAGSFALTADGYVRAVDMLSNLSLSSLFLHDRRPRGQLHDVIAFYSTLCDHHLETTRDLFCFLISLIQDVRKMKYEMAFANEKASAGILCAWTARDVEMVNNMMLKILRAVEGQWVSWMLLRGAVCNSQTSPELIDYCLKGLAGARTHDGLVVGAKCNADANTIEYRLQPVFDCPGGIVKLRSPHCQPTEEQLLRDLRFLYESLLNPDTMHSFKPSTSRARAIESARRLLDCKQFVKHYDKASILENSFPLHRHVWCELLLLDQPQGYTAPPPELVVLPSNATLGDLKLAVSQAFQETYIIFQKFKVEEIVNLGRISDHTTVSLLLSNGCTILVKGRCNDDGPRLREFCMERGIENWTVDCVCGAQDDDGERMVACDDCGVWRHTRCMGVNDSDEVPKRFICWKCSKPPKITAHLRKPHFKRDRDDDSGRCKTDASENTLSGYPKVCTKRSNCDDGRCKDEISPTGSCVTHVNQFSCLTSVG